MKKFLLILIFVFCTISVSAKHLEFMRIPINGTITNFQTKLQTKGFRADKASTQAGVKQFKGIFAGRKSTVVVWYNTRSKTVYSVRVVLYGDIPSTKEMADGIFENYKILLSQKYGDYFRISDGDVVWSISEKQKDESVAVGSINLQIGEYDSIYLHGEYYVFLTYTDSANADKNDQSKINDL